MIKIVICKKADQIRSFSVKGHSMYDDYGHDIVCAGVSAIAQSALLGLEHVARIKIISEIKEGFLSVDTTNTNEKAMAILDTMEISLKAICDTYPDNARIEYRRCDDVKN